MGEIGPVYAYPENSIWLACSIVYNQASCRGLHKYLVALLVICKSESSAINNFVCASYDIA